MNPILNNILIASGIIWLIGFGIFSLVAIYNIQDAKISKIPKVMLGILCIAWPLAILIAIWGNRYATKAIKKEIAMIDETKEVIKEAMEEVNNDSFQEFGNSCLGGLNRRRIHLYQILREQGEDTI